MLELLKLYWSFFQIGLFTFGGGYAMLPMIRKEVVNKHGWATEEEVLNYYAIGQCTPGIIAVNTATFIGYKQKKILGGIMATFGVVTPSVIIITIIATLLQNFSDIEYVQYAFSGIRVGVVVLVLGTIIGLLKKAIKNYISCIYFGAALLIALLTDISVIWIVVAVLGISIVKETINGKKTKEEEK